MKKLTIEELVPGMTIATDVYTYNDQLILPKGLVLTDKSITRLRFYSISYINIEDNFVNNSFPFNKEEDKPTAYSDSLKSKAVFNEFKSCFEDTIHSFSNTMINLVEHNSDIDTNLLLEQTLAIFKINNGDFNLFNMLHNLRTYDDDTFAHSINVSLICNVFATWLNMNAEDVKTATLAGLLHDIGKLKIPDTIVHKPARLTESEYEIIKTHPTEGYRILQSMNINQHVKNAALMHHERCNGSGYPLGLVGDQIDPIAKLVSIVDVYEATTAPRIYRGPLSPFEVIGLFQSEGIQKYDVLYIMTFLENIVNTYMHYGVVLNDGTEGTIIFINKQDLSRPIIRSGNRFIDLTANPTLSIVRII